MVISEVKSASRPNVTHKVMRSDKTNKVYCTCEAWRYGKGQDCKHIKAIRSMGEGR